MDHNDVYLVRAADGAYFLKVYRFGWRSASEIAYELDLLGHLAANGVGVAPAIPRRDGRAIGALHAPEGPRPCVLFAAAAGTKPSPPFTAALYHHVDQAMVRFHQATDDFTSRHARAPLDLAHLIDRPLAALHPWLAHRHGDWACLVRLAAQVRPRLASLAAAGLD